MRVLEIAHVDVIPIAFIATEEDYEVAKADAKVLGLREFQSNNNVFDAYMVYQLYRCDRLEDLVHGTYTSFETLEDVIKRANEAREWLRENNITEMEIKDEAGRTLLKTALDRLGLSIAAYHQIIHVAMCIAALDKSKLLRAEHIAEAIQYQCVPDEPFKQIIL
jgi:hypothetical protein